MLTTTDPTSERTAALVDAYRRVIAVQFQPSADQLEAPLNRARARGWSEVEFMLRYGEYCQASTSSVPSAWAVERSVRRMRDVVDRLGDPILDALTMAVEARLRGIGLGVITDGLDTGAVDLASAVARLDDADPSQPCRGIAYIACGVAYGQAGSSQLEIDMYARAEQSDRHLPEAFGEFVSLNANECLQNRVTSMCELSCEQAERGERARAAEIAGRALEYDPPDHSAAPIQQIHRAWAEQRLLAALARTPESGVSLDEAFPGHELHPVAVGYNHLASAVRHCDSGDLNAAANAAELAVQYLESDLLDIIKRFALSIAARRPPVSAYLERYTRVLLDGRWNAQQQLIGAARSRVQSEAVRIENARLTERAFSDELTGLGNRHALARLQQSLSHQTSDDSVGVVMVDVDEFKAINDTFGHSVGDNVLRRLAALLSAHIRSGDLVVRLGGDEFMITMQDATGEQVATLAERLFLAVAHDNWDAIALGLRVGVSLGVAAGSVGELERVIDRADRGLYISKNNGRGRVSEASPERQAADAS